MCGEDPKIRQAHGRSATSAGSAEDRLTPRLMSNSHHFSCYIFIWLGIWRCSLWEEILSLLLTYVTGDEREYNIIIKIMSSGNRQKYI